jgi:DUF4097 and DUF4098 domain-containing protein YvlB
MKLIVRLVTVFVIVLLAVGIAMAVSGDTFGLFGALSDKDSYSELLTWTADETVDRIKIDVDVRKVEVLVTDDPFVSVTYHAHEDDTWTFDHSESAIDVRQRHQRSLWFFSFGIVPEEFRTMTLNVPRSSVHGLEIHTDVGDIVIESRDNDLFDDLDLDSDTGTISLVGITVQGGMSLSSSTGRVSVEGVDAASVTIDVSTGRVLLDDFTFDSLEVANSTGDVILRQGVVDGFITVDNSTGKIEVDGVSATSYDLKTSTGDIVVSLSDYDDIAMDLGTDIGRVKVFGVDQGKTHVDTTGSILLKAKVSTGSITIGD